MPLNYSKWDQLELSDDSDIEGHPNVDKKSLIGWRQRDIHEKREARKHKIAQLKAEIACNDILIPRITALTESLKSPPEPYTSTTQFLNATVEQLRTNPSPDAPPTKAPGQPTYDQMVLSLLLQVGEAAREAGGGKEDNDAEVGKRVVTGIESHIGRLHETQKQIKKDLEAEEKEQKKHITSEDIHDGFDSKYVPAPPPPEPVKGIKFDKPVTKKKKTTKTTEIEVLNPGAASSSTATPAADDSDGEEDEEDDDLGDELPSLTPGLEAFSQLPLGTYEKSWELIQKHRDIVIPGAYDALLVAAFRAQHAGKSKYAKQCVHQGLLLQYAEKLGRDGVRVFFGKMIARDQRAENAFTQDVEGTYNHLVERVRISKEEEEAAGGQEQIQLVPENPSQTIGFNVPDGPPPEDLRLEGPGTEDLDVEEVRKALQLRWEVFEGFSPDLQAALKEGTLDGVNRVLGELPVPEAEEVVRLLDIAGILSFADGGVRDETGRGDSGKGKGKEVEASDVPV